MSNFRTRFAPSPTGYLHVGGIRTALFAWLLARQNNGQFILRLEDTDQKREVAGAKEHLIKSLNELGLNYDEGPDIGGPYGPYCQSERLETYKTWANKLIEQGRAYADPYSASEVDSFRQQASATKQPFLYRNFRPANSPKWQIGMPLRFKSDPKDYKWQDAVMGNLNSPSSVVDDFVLIKSDGFPTYNFAHIIDDQTMEISHVLRGQEFLASVPNYLNLYEALGFNVPVLATLPPVMGPDGKKKLSKRDGAKDVLEYLKEGYLKDALISFIATLGWNDGSTQEIFTTDQLIDKFSLDRIGKSGALFDDKRLNWINGNIIRSLSIEELNFKASNYWPTEANNYPEDYKIKVLSLYQDRLKYLAELAELSRQFFVDLPINPSLIKDHKQLSTLTNQQLIDLLIAAREVLDKSDFSETDLSQKLNFLLEQTSQKPAVLFSLIRIAVSQAQSSPGLSDTLATLGKERSLARLNKQIDYLNK